MLALIVAFGAAFVLLSLVTARLDGEAQEQQRVVKVLALDQRGLATALESACHELNVEIRREAERMRAYKVLSKPIRLRQLSDLVCGALQEIYGWCPETS